jgi:hypothetical protein
MEAFLASLRAALSAHPGIVGPRRLAWVWSAVRRVAAFKPDREVSLADIYGLLIAMQWLHTWREPSADRMAGTLR